MGYRSKVAYVIKFHDIERRDAFVSLMLAEGEQFKTEAVNDTRHDYKTDPIITFEQRGVKWYESYPDVQAHHKLMQDAVDLFEAGYRFVRVGEEHDDIQVDSNSTEFDDLCEYVDPVTDVRTDFPAE